MNFCKQSENLISVDNYSGDDSENAERTDIWTRCVVLTKTGIIEASMSILHSKILNLGRLDLTNIEVQVSDEMPRHHDSYKREQTPCTWRITLSLISDVCKMYMCIYFCECVMLLPISWQESFFRGGGGGNAVKLYSIKFFL